QVKSLAEIEAEREAVTVESLLPLMNLPRGDHEEELRAQIEQSTREILATHGLQAFARPRELACAHETMHAIVAAAEGFAITRVHIRRVDIPGLGESWGGSYHEGGRPNGHWVLAPDDPPEAKLKRARVIFAGWTAEYLQTHSDANGNPLEHSDEWR